MTTRKPQAQHTPMIGEHVYSVGMDRLGTLRDTFTDQDGMTRAKVQHFNGEWWQETPPLCLLERV